jgi:hypothetical protein
VIGPRRERAKGGALVALEPLTRHLVRRAVHARIRGGVEPREALRIQIRVAEELAR